MDFKEKTILAPMVRVSTLPIRLLALDYGADIVYSEEIVDLRIIGCQRIVNDVLGTIDYIASEDEAPIFRTIPQTEKSKLVFQVGTNDPEKAVAVGKIVEQDVSAFDVNMGCPKPFSVHSGMGAALLKESETAEKILTSLVNALTIPVTCKIRVLDTLEETLKFCHMVERCGIAALTVHGRRKDERPRHPNRNSEIREIARNLSIPVIANGGSRDIQNWADIESFKQETGCSSVMLARVAQNNPSIFRRDGPLHLDSVIPDYIKYAVRYGAQPQNVKYVVQRMLGEEQSTTERGQKLLASYTLRQMCKLWNLDDYYLETMSKRRDRSQRGDGVPLQNEKGHSLLSQPNIIELEIAIPRKNFAADDSPKYLLTSWCKKQKLKFPTYQTVQNKTKFRSVLSVNGKLYSSTCWERSKKFSEQAAAMVCLDHLGLRHLVSDDLWDEDYRPS